METNIYLRGSFTRVDWFWSFWRHLGVRSESETLMCQSPQHVSNAGDFPIKIACIIKVSFLLPDIIKNYSNQKGIEILMEFLNDQPHKRVKRTTAIQDYCPWPLRWISLPCPTSCQRKPYFCTVKLFCCVLFSDAQLKCLTHFFFPVFQIMNISVYHFYYSLNKLVMYVDHSNQSNSGLLFKQNLMSAPVG